MPPLSPDLYSYSDYRAYIRDWLALRKSRSYQTLADRVGCSKSLISQILKGTRILQGPRISAFADALKITEPQERAYFQAMVDLSDAPTLARRRAAKQVVEAAQHYAGTNRVGRETCRLYSRWYYLAVAELAGCRGFLEDPAWVAGTVLPPITPEQAEEALTVLQEIGLLVRDESGELVIGSWSSGHQVTDPMVAQALSELHPSLLSLASDAVGTVPSSERQYEFVTFSIPSGKMPAYQALISQFQQQVMGLAASTAGPGDRVYQLCVQLFPLSASPAEDADEDTP